MMTVDDWPDVDVLESGNRVNGAGGTKGNEFGSVWVSALPESVYEPVRPEQLGALFRAFHKAEFAAHAFNDAVRSRADEFGVSTDEMPVFDPHLTPGGEPEVLVTGGPADVFDRLFTDLD